MAKGHEIPYVTDGRRIYFEAGSLIWLMRLRAEYLAGLELEGAKTSASLLAYEIADELETAHAALTREEYQDEGEADRPA